MSTHNHRRPPAPIIRPCELCGEPNAIVPVNEEHRKAHLKREIAFVCQSCADRVRMEVEAAGGTTAEEHPQCSA